ncbi:hypothetical protein MRB53_041024 [Persea americana]|nr:hypothetical protein MRB53_041024 [Persea americana]
MQPQDYAPSSPRNKQQDADFRNFHNASCNHPTEREFPDSFEHSHPLPMRGYSLCSLTKGNPASTLARPYSWARSPTRPFSLAYFWSFASCPSAVSECRRRTPLAVARSIPRVGVLSRMVDVERWFLAKVIPCRLSAL